MFDSTPEDTVCSLHLPPFDVHSWAAAFLAEKWVMYKRPTMVVSKAEHMLDNRTLHCPGDNTQFWASFHKTGRNPLVPAGYLQGHPDKVVAKLAQIWNTGVIVNTHKVPQAERVKDENGKYLRTQQLRGTSVAKIVHMYSRASIWEPQVVILDPFAGVGGSLVAAKITGNYFVGVEKNKECVAAMEEMWTQLDASGVVGYENGAALRGDLLKGASEEGDDEDAEGGTHTRRYVGIHVTQGPNLGG